MRRARRARPARWQVTGPAMRRVTIAAKGDKYKSIDAYVFGDWAAHEDGTGREFGWAVTLLLGGRAVKTPVLLDKDAAQRAARWLSEHIERDELLDWANIGVAVSQRIRRGIALAAGVLP